MRMQILFGFTIILLLLSSCTLLRNDYEGSILVEGDEGTIIYLNDRAIGTINSSGEILIEKLKPGSVSLRAVRNNENIELSVNITPKKIAEINMSFNITEEIQERKTPQYLLFRINADKEGKYPIRNARIKLWNPEGYENTFFTDHLGSVSINISKGNWNYEIIAEGFETQTNSIQIQNEDFFAEKVQMIPLKAVTVYILTQSGVLSTSPIPNIAIKLRNDYDQEKTVTTNEQGMVTVSLYPGRWNYEILTEGYNAVSQHNPLDIMPGESQTERIGLLRAAGVPVTIEVRSGTASGTLIGGARITLTDSRGDTITRITDDSSYLTVSLSPGSWSYTITASGYETRQGIIDVKGSTSIALAMSVIKLNQGTQTIEIKSGHYLSGTPIMGATITITEPSGKRTSKTTDSQGKATFTGEIGSWMVEVIAPNHEMRQLAVDVSEYTNQNVKIGMYSLPLQDVKLDLYSDVQFTRFILKADTGDLECTTTNYHSTLPYYYCTVYAKQNTDYQTTSIADGYYPYVHTIKVGSKDTSHASIFTSSPGEGNITFMVKSSNPSGNTNIQGATISLESGETCISDSTGKCFFSYISAEKNNYTVVANNHHTVTSSINVQNGINMNMVILMMPIQTGNVIFDVKGMNGSYVYPLRGAVVGLGPQYNTTNSQGITTFQITPGSYFFMINVSGHHGTTGTINVISGTTQNATFTLNTII